MGVLAKDFGLAVRPAPVDLPGFTISMGWHERFADDRRHRWIREWVAGAVRTAAVPR